MENCTVRVAPELDPRQAMTQLSLQRVREQRRGHWGVVGAAAAGTVLAVIVYSALPGTAIWGPAFKANATAPEPPLSHPAEKAAGASAVAASNAAPKLVAAGARPTLQGPLVAEVPLDRDGERTGIVEEITDAPQPNAAVANVQGVAQPHAEGSAGRSQTARVQASRNKSTANQTARPPNGSARSDSKASTSEPAPAETDPEWLKREGPKVWLE
jgi:hypothetical protein